MLNHIQSNHSDNSDSDEDDDSVNLEKILKKYKTETQGKKIIKINKSFNFQKSNSLFDKILLMNSVIQNNILSMF